MIVTVQHCAELGYCMKQVRPWFVANGLDFMDFVKNGIEEEKLSALGDSYADRIVAHARGEDRDGRR